MGRRKSSRRRSNARCKTNEWEMGIDEEICNLSSSGCKINTNLIYDPGEIIGVKIGTVYHIGIVMREDKTGYGIKFLE